MIDRETIDRIYAAADIVEVISDYVTLKRKGVNYQACCPFHNEKTPSFVVSPSKGVYKCFGCGKGGNAVSFIMEHESVTYPEALKMVARKYGIEVHEREQTEEDVRRNNNRESMFALNSWAADYFVDYLHGSDEGRSVGMTYFRGQRGFSDATIKKFGLGFCPSKGDRMSQDAMHAGYKEEFLLSTGLSIKRESDGRIYDRFRERVIFPVHNISGRVVAFGGRTLRTDKSVAKYQNSPESEIYSKKNEIYGLYFAKKAIQQQDSAIMVEGYTDVISMHQSGVENVVASSGTSLTTEQIRLLGRFTRNVTVMYDGDSAGIHASLRGIDMILREGMNVYTVLLPPEDDPDSFARKHSATELREYIEANRENFITFKIKLLLRDAADDPVKRSQVITDIVHSMAQIPDNIQRSLFIREGARLLDMDEGLLIGEVARRRMASFGDREAEEFVRREGRRRREEAAAGVTQAAQVDDRFGSLSLGSSIETLEREIVYYLLLYGDCRFEFREGRRIVEMHVATEIIKALDACEIVFDNKNYQVIVDIWRQALRDGRTPDHHEFVNHYDHEVSMAAISVLAENESYVESKIWSQKEMHTTTSEEMLAVGIPRIIKLRTLKHLIGMIDEQQRQLDREGLTDDEMLALMQELTRLNRAKVTLARELQRSVV
ncbi:MAG: DNA primase [Alistipes sp.]|nr:DNA primase [Alistipes sp.]